MKTIREIYRIGIGPSSSHTMGPRKAAELYKERFPEAAAYRVTLYGSLSATGMFASNHARACSYRCFVLTSKL